MSVKPTLETKIKQAVKTCYQSSTEVVVERPANPAHGDYATSVALALAKEQKATPLEIAEKLKDSLKGELPDFMVSVAKPGFINFSLTLPALRQRLQQILDKGDCYGNLELGKQQRVNVEFVSANPTGPLHIGNFRGGPLGDTIARLLEKAGYAVTREYYHNDLGEQVRKLGESIFYWQQLERGEEAVFPEEGYEGEYVKRLAKKLPEAPAPELGEKAIDFYLQQALAICREAEIKFDVISKESEIVKSGKTAEAVARLQKKGVLQKKENALWFTPQDKIIGDRECVLQKSDGKYTYFANDLGYHWDKWQRGFSWAISVLGANHHGHILRMRSALHALSLPDNWLTNPLYQWVTITRDGKPVSASKRKGNIITAQEVLAEVGKDALRWFFLSRDAKTPIRFDLDLAKKQAKENPVFYVQYAHARICALLRKAGDASPSFTEGDTRQNIAKEELALARELVFFPDLVEELARSLAVHQLTLYATRLADAFHKFYEACPIIDNERQTPRLAIAKATKIILANTLSLLGISAPEKM